MVLVLVLVLGRFPHALHHLQLLQNEQFRDALKNTATAQWLSEKQFDHWRTWYVSSRLPLSRHLFRQPGTHAAVEFAGERDRWRLTTWRVPVLERVTPLLVDHKRKRRKLYLVEDLLRVYDIQLRLMCMISVTLRQANHSKLMLQYGALMTTISEAPSLRPARSHTSRIGDEQPEQRVWVYRSYTPEW